MATFPCCQGSTCDWNIKIRLSRKLEPLAAMDGTCAHAHAPTRTPLRARTHAPTHPHAHACAHARARATPPGGPGKTPVARVGYITMATTQPRPFSPSNISILRIIHALRIFRVSLMQYRYARTYG